MNNSHRRVTFPMGTNKPINITIMETFTFRYAMAIEIRANSKKEAKEIFENMNYDKLLIESEYVELEDISENNW